MHIGAFDLRWYSLAYLAGIFIGYWYLLKLLKQPGAPLARRHADDLVFYAALGIILGGRIGYVLFYNLGEYLRHPIEILKLWDGGMSFHGGVIGTSLGIFYFARKEKLSWLRIHDYVACCAPFGLFFGRLANFVNQELWGAPTHVSWAVRFVEMTPYGPILGPPRHPSQIYEAVLEGIVLFCDPRLDVLEDATPASNQASSSARSSFSTAFPLRHRIHPRARPAADPLHPGYRPSHGPVVVASDDLPRPVADADREKAASARRGHRRARQRIVTPLERALRDRIRDEGPIGVEAFMEACNSYYYATRDPLGARGDFTTAPEISQMFGEMVGACLADCWRRAGSQEDAIYAELGPGRGTLASDALRVLHSAGFAGEVHFVETSPILRDVQEEAVPSAQWHDSVTELPGSAAAACRQRISRCTSGEAACRRDGATDRNCRRAALPSTATARSSKARRRVTKRSPRLPFALQRRAASALFIDYGHERRSAGDTLQAVRGHAFSPVLDNPGEQDLTAHVDFDAVGRAATDAGAFITPVVTQCEWLIRLGIGARAEALSNANPERAEDIERSLHRLTATDQMGGLFKAIALHSKEWPVPAGFA